MIKTLQFGHSQVNVQATLTVIIGVVSRPHAKNSRKMTTRAWYKLGSPMPEPWEHTHKTVHHIESQLFNMTGDK